MARLKTGFGSREINPLLAIAVIAIFSLTGLAVLRSSSAATVTVSGKVIDSRTGAGVGGVTILGCSSHGVNYGPKTTVADGTWSFLNVAVGNYYCARVTAGIPAGWSGPLTITQEPEHVGSPTYENQVAGTNCYHNISLPCNSLSYTWDRSTDTGFNFYLTSPAPPPPPVAPPPPPVAPPPPPVAPPPPPVAPPPPPVAPPPPPVAPPPPPVAPPPPPVAPPPPPVAPPPNSGGTGTGTGGTGTGSSGTGTGTGTGGSGSGSAPSSSPSPTPTPGPKPIIYTPTLPPPKAAPPPRSTPQPQSGAQQPQPDTNAPSAPTNLSAVSIESSLGIQLTWTASTDNVGVAGYKLERSTDQLSWDTVAENVLDTVYEDDTVNFNTTYTYRLSAYDAANNYSDFAETIVTSAGFKSNVDPTQDATITSNDKLASILIPAESLAQSAFCTIATSISNLDTLPATNSKILAGPYQLVCRDANGSILSGFSKPVTLSLQRSKINTSGIASVSYYGYNNGHWQVVQPKSQAGQDNVLQFDISQLSSFVVMGKKKSTPFWVWIIVTLLVLAGLAVAAIYILRVMQRRKFEEEYNDYVSKTSGGV